MVSDGFSWGAHFYFSSSRAWLALTQETRSKVTSRSTWGSWSARLHTGLCHFPCILPVSTEAFKRPAPDPNHGETNSDLEGRHCKGTCQGHRSMIVSPQSTPALPSQLSDLGPWSSWRWEIFPRPHSTNTRLFLLIWRLHYGRTLRGSIWPIQWALPWDPQVGPQEGSNQNVKVPGEVLKPTWGGQGESYSVTNSDL